MCVFNQLTLKIRIIICNDYSHSWKIPSVFSAAPGRRDLQKILGSLDGWGQAKGKRELPE